MDPSKQTIQKLEIWSTRSLFLAHLYETCSKRNNSDAWNMRNNIMSLVFARGRPVKPAVSPTAIKPPEFHHRVIHFWIHLSGLNLWLIIGIHPTTRHSQTFSNIFLRAPQAFWTSPGTHRPPSAPLPWRRRMCRGEPRGTEAATNVGYLSAETPSDLRWLRWLKQQKVLIDFNLSSKTSGTSFSWAI